MEFILIVAVLAVLCVIFQVSTDIIIMCVALFTGLVISVMTLLFIYFFIRLLFSRKKEAYFSKIDIPEKTKFRTAYYIVDGKEYQCIFPCEGIFLNKLYQSEKKYHVWLSRNNKFVFDRFAFTTCIVGFSVCIFLVTALVIMYLAV